MMALVAVFRHSDVYINGRTDVHIAANQMERLKLLLLLFLRIGKLELLLLQPESVGKTSCGCLLSHFRDSVVCGAKVSTKLAG